MVVFTFVFGTLINVNTYDIPYPVFSFAALVPWTLFSKGLSQSATSVKTNTGLVTKIYFPRLIMPISAFMNVLLDFFLSLIVLFIMLIGFGFFPTFRMLWIVSFLGLTIMTGMGLGFWFSALQVRMRDINYILPFILNIMIYITPVAYPSNLVTGNLKFIYGLNPMVTVCDGFRWALLGIDTFSTETAIVSFISGTLIFVSGALFFERSQSSFVDYL
jgi:lipopolysaccharide transport system permease protein